MTKLLFVTLFLGAVAACSGKSKRSAYTPEPGAGGSIGAAGEGAAGTTAMGQAGRGSGGANGLGGRAGEGARGGRDGARAGSDGEGATAATMSMAARAGSEGEGASGGSTGAKGGNGGASAGSAGTSPVTTCNGEFGFLGTWSGDVLDFYFEPMQSVRLEFTEDESGAIFGRIKWGEGEPPPPPVDGDTPYPPGYWDDPFGMRGGRAPEPWPGFPYTVQRGAGCDATLRFGVSTTELWNDWCGMMEPIYTDEFGWGCILQGGGSISQSECVAQAHDGQTATYPTWKCAACGMLGDKTCACEESGCFSNPESNLTFDFSLAMSDGKQVLTGKDPLCADCTMRLTREE